MGQGAIDEVADTGWRGRWNGMLALLWRRYGVSLGDD